MIYINIGNTCGMSKNYIAKNEIIKLNNFNRPFVQISDSNARSVNCILKVKHLFNYTYIPIYKPKKFIMRTISNAINSFISYYTIMKCS